jgi:hypothetical protein
VAATYFGAIVIDESLPNSNLYGDISYTSAASGSC